uniref:hypothetical protein n=1 Tax=Pseudonocardia sp. CA-138482 TaxID=3240023 RepID=UPI003F498CF7
MSMHTEWDVAATCCVGTYTASEAEEEFHADVHVESDYVLVLGGDGGGCLAVEGNRAQLISFSDRIRSAVLDLPIDAEVISAPAAAIRTAGPLPLPPGKPISPEATP